MVNKHKIFGKRWETTVFNAFVAAGLDVWHLGFTERADMLVVSGKDRIFECKASHERVYDFRKNKKQHETFIKYLEEHPDVSGYYVFNFVLGNKSIKFCVYALDTKNLKWIDPFELNLRKFSLNEVINHIKYNTELTVKSDKNILGGF